MESQWIIQSEYAAETGTVVSFDLFQILLARPARPSLSGIPLDYTVLDYAAETGSDVSFNLY